MVLVYRLPQKWKRDFDLVRKGRYSLTSGEYQDLIPKTTPHPRTGLTTDSLQQLIFRRDESLRKHWEEKMGVNLGEKDEVWGGYIMENETLDIEKLKQYVEQANL